MSAVLVSANPQLRNHTLGGHRQRALDGAAAGAFVASAAERLGHRCNVYCTLAAQAYSEASIGLLAEEQSDFDAPNRQGVVDQALAVFLLRFTALHSPVADVHPGQAAVAMQSAEGRTEQPHLRELVEKYTLWAIFTGSAPARTNSCARAKVRSVVPVKQNAPVSVRTAVYRQVATSGEIFTPASRASRKIISAVAQAFGSIQFTSAKGRAVA